MKKLIELGNVNIHIGDGNYSSKYPRASEFINEGIPFISASDFSGRIFDEKGMKYISEELHGTLLKGHLKERDILVVVRGNGCGKVGFVPEEYEDANINAQLALLRCDNVSVNSEFLYYLLSTTEYQYKLKALSSGSAQPQLTISSLKKLQLDLPEYQYQLKIAKIAKAIDDKILVNTAINRNLSEQAKAIFEQELLRFDDVPEDWNEGNLTDIADYLNGLAMQKFRPAEGEEGLPVLKIKELRQGSCDASSELCSPNIKPEFIIRDGDVIFSWSGSLLVDFWCGGECGLNQHLFKVTSKKYDKWFYYAWTLYHLDRFIAVAADKATTMGHIKREELSKAEVLIPSKVDYKRIGEVLGPIYDMIVSNRIANLKLAMLRDKLLPKLMSGELDVSEVEL